MQSPKLPSHAYTQSCYSRYHIPATTPCMYMYAYRCCVSGTCMHMDNAVPATTPHACIWTMLCQRPHHMHAYGQCCASDHTTCMHMDNAVPATTYGQCCVSNHMHAYGHRRVSDHMHTCIIIWTATTCMHIIWTSRCQRPHACIWTSGVSATIWTCMSVTTHMHDYV